MAQFGICEQHIGEHEDDKVEQCGVLTPFLYKGLGYRCQAHRPLIKPDKYRIEHNVGLNRKQKRAKFAGKKS